MLTLGTFKNDISGRNCSKDRFDDAFAGRRSTQDEGFSGPASSRRASSTPSQAYDERPAVARGSYAAAATEAAAAPVPAPAARALNMDRALAASPAPESAGAQNVVSADACRRL